MAPATLLALPVECVGELWGLNDTRVCLVDVVVQLEVCLLVALDEEMELNFLVWDVDEPGWSRTALLPEPLGDNEWVGDVAEADLGLNLS